jgi:hypothetical protein
MTAASGDDDWDDPQAKQGLVSDPVNDALRLLEMLADPMRQSGTPLRRTRWGCWPWWPGSPRACRPGLGGDLVAVGERQNRKYQAGDVRGRLRCPRTAPGEHVGSMK